MSIFGKFDSTTYPAVIEAINQSYISRNGYTAYESRDNEARNLLQGEALISKYFKDYFLYDSVHPAEAFFTRWTNFC